MEKAERAPTGKSLIRIGPPSHWMTGPKALERARVLEKTQKGKERAKPTRKVPKMMTSTTSKMRQTWARFCKLAKRPETW